MKNEISHTISNIDQLYSKEKTARLCEENRVSAVDLAVRSHKERYRAVVIHEELVDLKSERTSFRPRG